MLKTIALCGLSIVGMSAQATVSDSPYTRWCARSAAVEKVAPEQREEFIQECIDTLEEADNNPGKASSRKRKEDDEG